MRTPRREWAAQRGEEVARDHGFDDCPVDPFAIARAEDIVLQPLEARREGINGCIVFVGDQVAILHRQNPDHPGTERFSVAHELGHYFLEDHPDLIRAKGGQHTSYGTPLEGRDPLEVEADSFAAGLLMPAKAVTWLLRRAPKGLDAIRALKSSAFVSLTAAAIRAAPLAPYPMAVILSRGDQVTSSYLSGPMKRMGRLRYPRRGDALPHTATRAFNSDEANVKKAETWSRDSDAAGWFECPEPLPLIEEVMGLGRSGGSLTVLTLSAS